MTKAYERWIRAWEDRLCNRATNRVVRHFEWGLDWTRNWPSAQRYPKNGETPEDYIFKLNQAALLDSDEFFAYERPGIFVWKTACCVFTHRWSRRTRRTMWSTPSGFRPKALRRPWSCCPTGIARPTHIMGYAEDSSGWESPIFD